MMRARVLYAGAIWSMMCLAPVHHISEPHIMAERVAVWVKWLRALGDAPFLFVILHRYVDCWLSLYDAAAAWILKPSRWLIHTPRLFMQFVGVIREPYREMTFLFYPKAFLMPVIMRMISLFFGE